MKSISAVFGLVLLLSAFTVVAQPSLTTINSATDAVCSCLAEPYRAMASSMTEVKEAQINGNFSQIQSVQNKVFEIIQSAESCIKNVSLKYPEIDKSSVLQEKVIEKIEGQCPSPI